jgi:hypothetical protein
VSTDLAGVAEIIGAVGVALTGIVSSGLSIASFIRSGRVERAQKAIVLGQGELMAAGQGRDAKLAAVDAKVDVVHDLVNDLSDKRDAATQKSAHAEGVIAGAEAERAHPTITL